METWKNMLENRSTTFAWSDKEVTKETIQSMLDDLHNHVPSKQAMMPYTIKVLDWSDVESRHTIFANTHRDSERTVENDYGNPQTLAPWLLAFTPRRPVEDEEYSQYEGAHKEGFFHRMANLEIGIASSFMVWSAAARGLSTGYCGCMNELEGSKKMIAQVLNPGQIDPDEPTVLLGIGYKDDEATTYLDPRTNKQKVFPTNIHANLRRPDTSLYVSWLTK
jgi:hypothetical protein